MAITFDTLEYVNKFKAADVPEKQALAMAQALRGVLDTALAEQARVAHEATERTVSELDSKTERAILKLEGEVALLRKDMDNSRWIERLVLGGIIALILKSFL